MKEPTNNSSTQDPIVSNNFLVKYGEYVVKKLGSNELPKKETKKPID